MAAFVVRRLLLTLPVVWIVVTLVFALIHLVPGDPIAQMLGAGAPAPEIQRMRHALGLDQSLAAQYKTYIAGVVRGDLGVSFRNQESVSKVIGERFPATLELTIAAIVVSLILAVPAGVVASVRRGSLADKAIGVFSLFGVSMP